MRASSSAAFWIFFAFALFLALYVFRQNLNAEFVNFDDPNVVVNSEVIRGPGSGHLTAVFSEVRDQAYLPLYYASYWIDYGLFGLSSEGFHLVNILFHVLNAALLFLLWHRLFPEQPWGMPAFAAGLFLIHPVVVESVSWVSSRKDLVSMALLLGGLLVWHSSLIGRRASWGFALAAFLFLAAMFAKATVLVAPIIAWLILCQVRRNPDLPRIVSRSRQNLGLLAWCGVSVAATGFHFFVARGQGTADVGVGGLGERLAGMLAILGRYLGHLFLPFGLSVHYDHAFGDSFGIEHLNGICALASVVVAAWWFWRRGGWVSFAWLWLFASLIPFNNIMPRFSIAMADRYLYLGTAGFTLAIAALLWGLFAKRQWLAAILSVVLIAGYGYLAHDRTQVWATSETLWANAIEVSTKSSLAPIQFGNALETRAQQLAPGPRQEKLESAAKHYALAQRRAANALESSQARMKLAPLLVRLNRPLEALAVFDDLNRDLRRLAQSIDDETKGRLAVSRSAAHLSLGQLDEARDRLRSVGESSPHFTDACNLLAFADIVEANQQLRQDKLEETERLAAQALFDGGLEKYAAILKIDPQHQKTRVEQVQALAAVTWRGDALIDASRLVRNLVDDYPKNAQARYLRGRLYAEVDPAQAERDLKIAIQLDPLRVEAYLLYENIMRNQGRNKEAIAALELGLRAVPESAALKLAMSESFLSFAFHYRNTKDPVSALKAVVRSLRFSDNNLEARLLRAELIQERAGDHQRKPRERAADWETSREEFELVLKNSPQEIRASRGLAAYHRARGLALLYKAAGRKRGSAEETAAYDDLALALRYNGDDSGFENTKRSMLVYSKRLAKEATKAMDDGDYDLALSRAERSLMFSSYLGDRYALLARVRRRRGEDQLALTNYDLALQTEPRNLRCLFELAQLRFDCGAWAEASLMFRRFVVTALADGYGDALTLQIDSAKKLIESADKLKKIQDKKKLEDDGR